MCHRCLGVDSSLEYAGIRDGSNLHASLIQQIWSVVCNEDGISDNISSNSLIDHHQTHMVLAKSHRLKTTHNAPSILRQPFPISFQHHGKLEYNNTSVCRPTIRFTLLMSPQVRMPSVVPVAQTQSAIVRLPQPLSPSPPAPVIEKHPSLFIYLYVPSSGGALPYSAEPHISATHHPAPGAIGRSGPAS